MKLTVLDRLSLLNVLPKEGDFLTLSIVRDVTKKVSIEQEEAKVIELNFKDNRVTWKQDAPELEVNFTESELSVIRKQLKSLDSQKKLTMELLETYKKFNADEEEVK